ncbi:MAG TPA: 30S ribosomal protein S3, partial [Anaerolineae bacterium]|nr:30S ribosomal protein S3 [Anaerolineae bacterium]
MGQKVNPRGFRIGITENWRSRWFASRDFDKTLREDLTVRRLLDDKLKRAAV